jgi:tRNA(adenine34) deaminase
MTPNLRTCVIDLVLVVPAVVRAVPAIPKAGGTAPAGASYRRAGRCTPVSSAAMNYELFMGEALAEARVALAQGTRPSAAVAVVHDAMVARAHYRVQESNDPTAHAVVVALREAARKLGRAGLGEATIFATREPCPMCVGALLASDVEALVFACPNPVDGAAGTIVQLAQHGDLPRRLRLVTGIRRDEAEELFAAEAEQHAGLPAATSGRTVAGGPMAAGQRA